MGRIYFVSSAHYFDRAVLARMRSSFIIFNSDISQHVCYPSTSISTHFLSASIAAGPLGHTQSNCSPATMGLSQLQLQGMCIS